jgi:hypothetical protein
MDAALLLPMTAVLLLLLLLLPMTADQQQQQRTSLAPARHVSVRHQLPYGVSPCQLSAL